MINNKYLLWPVLIAVLIFCMIWVFNHVNGWSSILLVVASVFFANQYFKPKNKE
jgi:hypothetical protein